MGPYWGDIKKIDSIDITIYINQYAMGCMADQGWQVLDMGGKIHGYIHGFNHLFGHVQMSKCPNPNPKSKLELESKSMVGSTS